MQNKKNNFKVQIGLPFPLGVRKQEDKLYFSVYIPSVKECKLNILNIDTREKVATIVLNEKFKIGGIFAISIEKIELDEFLYNYEYNGKQYIDNYARYIVGREKWNKRVDDELKVNGAFRQKDFDWGKDKPLKIPFDKSIFYRLHVRGFTKHRSSSVKGKGTFLGIEEKLIYIKSLGITAIELMPAYEFNEMIIMDAETENVDKRFINYETNEVNEKPETKVNYWGYAKECNYFAVKSSYAFNLKYPELELKHMIKKAHEMGIEVIMEFSFQNSMNKNAILDCLRYWVLEYHIDGIKLNDNVVPTVLVATDPLLSEVKLITESWNINEIYNNVKSKEYENLAESNDGFLIDVRKFLKSDEGQVSLFANRFRMNFSNKKIVNYITNHNGFTLMDVYSYDIKHNEKNGEDNRDGSEYNYSWNCGLEGKTRRKKIVELRKKQIKNALLTLILSQGSPMILAGDEFGNSQSGNNNAYCQDNEMSWLNWNLLNTNKEIFDFTHELIKIREKHPILHTEEPLKMRDYISCGCPDLSFHGTKAWYPDLSNYSRVIGIMYCGKYAKITRKKDDNYFYFAYNMHWEAHEFDLPKLPEKMKWRILIDTGEKCGEEVNEESSSKDNILNQMKYLVNPRTVIVFIGI